MKLFDFPTNSSLLYNASLFSPSKRKKRFSMPPLVPYIVQNKKGKCGNSTCDAKLEEIREGKFYKSCECEKEAKDNKQKREEESKNFKSCECPKETAKKDQERDEDERNKKQTCYCNKSPPNCMCDGGKKSSTSKRKRSDEEQSDQCVCGKDSHSESSTSSTDTKEEESRKKRKSSSSNKSCGNNSVKPKSNSCNCVSDLSWSANTMQQLSKRFTQFSINKYVAFVGVTTKPAECSKDQFIKQLQYQQQSGDCKETCKNNCTEVEVCLKIESETESDTCGDDTCKADDDLGICDSDTCNLNSDKSNEKKSKRTKDSKRKKKSKERDRSKPSKKESKKSNSKESTRNKSKSKCECASERDSKAKKTKSSDKNKSRKSSSQTQKKSKSNESKNKSNSSKCECGSSKGSKNKAKKSKSDTAKSSKSDTSKKKSSTNKCECSSSKGSQSKKSEKAKKSKSETSKSSKSDKSKKKKNGSKCECATGKDSKTKKSEKDSKAKRSKSETSKSSKSDKAKKKRSGSKCECATGKDSKTKKSEKNSKTKRSKSETSKSSKSDKAKKKKSGSKCECATGKDSKTKKSEKDRKTKRSKSETSKSSKSDTSKKKKKGSNCKCASGKDSQTKKSKKSKSETSKSSKSDTSKKKKKGSKCECAAGKDSKTKKSEKNSKTKKSKSETSKSSKSDTSKKKKKGSNCECASGKDSQTKKTKKSKSETSKSSKSDTSKKKNASKCKCGAAKDEKAKKSDAKKRNSKTSASSKSSSKNSKKEKNSKKSKECKGTDSKCKNDIDESKCVKLDNNVCVNKENKQKFCLNRKKSHPNATCWYYFCEGLQKYPLENKDSQNHEKVMNLFSTKVMPSSTTSFSESDPYITKLQSENPKFGDINAYSFSVSDDFLWKRELSFYSTDSSNSIRVGESKSETVFVAAPKISMISACTESNWNQNQLILKTKTATKRDRSMASQCESPVRLAQEDISSVLSFCTLQRIQKHEKKNSRVQKCKSKTSIKDIKVFYETETRKLEEVNIANNFQKKREKISKKCLDHCITTDLKTNLTEANAYQKDCLSTDSKKTKTNLSENSREVATGNALISKCNENLNSKSITRKVLTKWDKIQSFLQTQRPRKKHVGKQYSLPVSKTCVREPKTTSEKHKTHHKKHKITKDHRSKKECMDNHHHDSVHNMEELIKKKKINEKAQNLQNSDENKKWSSIKVIGYPTKSRTTYKQNVLNLDSNHSVTNNFKNVCHNKPKKYVITEKSSTTIEPAIVSKNDKTREQTCNNYYNINSQHDIKKIKNNYEPTETTLVNKLRNVNNECVCFSQFNKFL